MVTSLVTFMIDDERPVSVVGDFNGWDPHRDPFVEELDGRRYVTVSVPADTVTCFRYLADGRRVLRRSRRGSHRAERLRADPRRARRIIAFGRIYFQRATDADSSRSADGRPQPMLRDVSG